MRLLVILLLLLSGTALAGQAEVRAVALQNGCKPTKIEVTRQTTGNSASIAYKVACEKKAASAPAAPELLIRCHNKLCVVY
jgi:hypothetical protein